MSYQPTRAVVEKVCEHFTHVRAPGLPAGFFLFNHRSEQAVPEKLRKVGAEVLIYRDEEDMLLKAKQAPERKVLPQRGGSAPAAPVSPTPAAAAPAPAAERVKKVLLPRGAVLPAEPAPAPKPKIPTRR